MVRSMSKSSTNYEFVTLWAPGMEVVAELIAPLWLLCVLCLSAQISGNTSIRPESGRPRCRVSSTSQPRERCVHYQIGTLGPRRWRKTINNDLENLFGYPRCGKSI